MLYLRGRIGNVPGTRQLADTGIAGQARQALENIKAVLASAGSSLEHAVKCTVFLTDIKDYAAMNTVYATYFLKDPPARSTVAGSGLAFGARVEIECLAVAGQARPIGGPRPCPGSRPRKGTSSARARPRACPTHPPGFPYGRGVLPRATRNPSG